MLDCGFVGLEQKYIKIIGLSVDTMEVKIELIGCLINEVGVYFTFCWS